MNILMDVEILLQAIDDDVNQMSMTISHLFLYVWVELVYK